MPMSTPRVEVSVLSKMGSKRGIQFDPLIQGIEELTQKVAAKIEMVRKKGEEGGGQEMSIADMFDLQMSMNKLQQFSEMSSSVVSSMNGSINSMARNIK
jgi:hypothetical protein